MRNIIENATIIYKNGFKKIVEALSITKNGIFIGKIIQNRKTKDEFINYSFIPRNQINKINFLNEKGELTHIFFENCDMEVKEK